MKDRSLDDAEDRERDDEPADLGGEPPCWAHMFDDLERDDPG